MLGPQLAAESIKLARDGVVPQQRQLPSIFLQFSSAVIRAIEKPNEIFHHVGSLPRAMSILVRHNFQYDKPQPLRSRLTIQPTALPPRPERRFPTSHPEKYRKASRSTGTSWGIKFRLLHDLGRQRIRLVRPACWGLKGLPTIYFCTALRRKQSMIWSLTIPVACIHA